MDNTVVSAIKRTEKPNKARRQGFIPGVIFGKGIESVSVKIDEKELSKVQHGHLRNARLSVKIGDEMRQCVVKEIQRDPVKGNVIHFNLQSIHDNDIIKLKVPLVFNGREKLAGRQLLLEDYISEIEISGKVSILPEVLAIEVGDFNAEEKILLKDIHVDEGIKVIGNEDEIIAVVSYSREAPAEEETSEEEKK